VEEVVSVWTKIPVSKLAEKESERLLKLESTLHKRVIGQEEAVTAVAKAIRRGRAGIGDPNRPIGSFLFLGPTGVGKTELSKALAEAMFGNESALIRVDMSEYMESHSVSKMIGSPPGYVGFEDGGQLSEKIRKNPYSVVLFDEIEKAHPDVFNILLQVLDDGRITDSKGRTVNFKNTVIIMTSNAGTRQLKEFGRGVGFNAGGTMGLSLNESDKEHARAIIQKSLSRQFAPEFLNRLDEIITFDQLDLEAIKKIIDIELSGLYQRVEKLGYQICLSNEAKEFVATKGYDVQFGARPLKRAIQNYIEDGLCERILSGEVAAGSTIRIDKHPQKEELVFS
jgi:ATP-dependent Clp protease ATP-binding subunit ClpC